MTDHDPSDPLTGPNLRDYAIGFTAVHVPFTIVEAFVPFPLPSVIAPIVGSWLAAKGHVRRGGGKMRGGPAWTFAFGAMGISLVIQLLIVLFFGGLLARGEEPGGLLLLGPFIPLGVPLTFFAVRIFMGIFVKMARGKDAPATL